MGDFRQVMGEVLVGGAALKRQIADFLERLFGHADERPVAVGLGQPAKALVYVEQQEFAPGKAVFRGAPQVADHLPLDIFQPTLGAQRNRQRRIQRRLRLDHQSHLVAGGVEHRPAGGAAEALDAATDQLERRGTGRAIERVDLRGRGGRAAGGLGVAQMQKLQIAGVDALADVHARHAAVFHIAVVDAGECGIQAQVDHRRGVAGAHLERQLALACDAGGRFQVGDLEEAPVQIDPVLDIQAFERWRRQFRRVLETDKKLASGFAQPAGALVVEHDVPLVPQPGVVAQLDASDDAEVHAFVGAFTADLQQGRIVLQRGHLADVFQHGTAFEQGRGAVAAYRKHRSRRFEFDRRAAGRAGGGWHGGLVCPHAASHGI